MRYLQGFTFSEEVLIQDCLVNRIRAITPNGEIMPEFVKAWLREMAITIAKSKGITPHSNYKLHNARELHIGRKETGRHNV